MMGHKIRFYGEIWIIIPKLSMLSLLIWSTVSPLFASSNKMAIDFCLLGYVPSFLLSADDKLLVLRELL